MSENDTTNEQAPVPSILPSTHDDSMMEKVQNNLVETDGMERMRALIQAWNNISRPQE
jgi:hypothetical protein